MTRIAWGEFPHKGGEVHFFASKETFAFTKSSRLSYQLELNDLQTQSLLET